MLFRSIEGLRDRIAAQDPFNDAEDDDAYWARLQPGFDTLLHDCVDGDKVLVASHGTTIRSIVSRFQPDIDVAVSALNGSVPKLKVHGSDISVAYYNRVDDQID